MRRLNTRVPVELFGFCIFWSGLAFPGSRRGQDARMPMKTFTYKTIGKLEIKADVYPAPGTGPHPVVMYIHGGALIMGDRSGNDKYLRQRLPKAGYTMVSIDYRLAPETKLPGIIEDLEAAYAWIRDKGPELFQADSTGSRSWGGPRVAT